MLTELLELYLGLIRRNLYMREVLCQSAALQFVLLILQFAFGKDDQPIGIGLQPLQGLLDLRQRGGREVEQRLAVAEQVGQLFCGEVVATHTEGRLDDADGKGLAAIAEVSHIARFGLEKFLGRNVTIGCDETVEMVLYFLEVRLTVP